MSKDAGRISVLVSCIRNTYAKAMFPLRDENPTFHKSVATFLIVAANIAVWIFVQKMGTHPGLLQSVWKLGIIPGELLGRVDPGTTIPVARRFVVVLDGIPNWYSLITSMFTHGGWLHLISNMWFLIVFGDNVEDAMGSFRFLAFYVLCGLAAAAAQIFSNPNSVLPMVGASGAIGGIMGAYLVLFPLAPIHMLVFLGFFATRVVVPAFLMLLYWFLLQLVMGLFDTGVGGVAFWAHVGGFLAGVFLVRLFCNPERLASCRSRRSRLTRLYRRMW